MVPAGEQVMVLLLEAEFTEKIAVLELEGLNEHEEMRGRLKFRLTAPYAEKEPDLQVKQELEDDMPVLVEYCPDLQPPVQTISPVLFVKEPAGHCTHTLFPV